MKNKESLSLKQKRIIGGLSVVLFIVFCGIVGWFIGRPMIKFVSEPEKFRIWVDEKGILGDISFIFMTIFQVLIALVPGEPLEIGAGYAFGWFKGTVLCVLGTTLGSLIVFFLVRKLGIRLVEVFFSYEKIKELKFLKDRKKVNIIIFLLYFLPGTPKDLITYFIGLTDIKFGYFLFLTSVARLPSVVTSTIGGNALGSQKYSMAIVVFTVTLIVSGLGWLIYNLILKFKNKREEKI